MATKSLPVLDLMMRIAGYGADGVEPAWVQFCAPAEQVIVNELLSLGRIRKELKTRQASCEAIGRKGHYLVAATTLAVRDLTGTFDDRVISLNNSMQQSASGGLQSIYATLIQFEPTLATCLSFLKWIEDDKSMHELSVGLLMDECAQRAQLAYGRAKEALDAIFDRVFEAFKRILVGWLAFGLFDARVDTFFIKEPVDCVTYFREIFPVIGEPAKAPADLSAELIEKIAQYGYIRRFLGYKTKLSSDLQADIVAQADALKKLPPRDYHSPALETIVTNFGNIYSKALYVKIFDECQVHQILKQFHLIYLMSLIDVFDDFIAQADPYLQKQPNAQNMHDVNAVFDRCFESTKFKRTYNPSFFDDHNGFPVEKTAEKGFDCFRFVFTPGVSAIGWDCINMDFQVQHPLDWFFHRKAIDKYKRIFRFLLRLKRLNIMFKKMFEGLRLAYWAGRLSFANYVEIFQWHHRFCCVNYAIQQYIQGDVIHIAWTEFQSRIHDLKDFIKLVEIHEAFLNKILAASFIDNEPFYKCVQTMAKTCLHICTELDDQLSKPANVEINLETVHAELADVNSLMNVFLKLVGQGTSPSGPTLTMLNLRMDFTDNTTGF